MNSKFHVGLSSWSRTANEPDDIVDCFIAIKSKIVPAMKQLIIGSDAATSKDHS